MHTLLVVDDNTQNIDVFRALLGKDFRLKAATSGERALQICLASTNIDLILLDVLMPEINGFSVCRALKKNPRTKHIPVIFVTSLNDEVNEKRGFEVGACDYVTKPLSMRQLRARIISNIKVAKSTQASVDGAKQQTLKTLDTIMNCLISGDDERMRDRFAIVESMRNVLANYDVENAVDYQISAILAALLNEPRSKSTEQDSSGLEKNSRKGINAELLKALPGTEMANSIVDSWSEELPQPSGESQYESNSELMGRLLLKASTMMSRGELHNNQEDVAAFISDYAPALPLKAQEDNVSYLIRVEELAAGMILAEAIMSNEGSMFVPAGTKLTVAMVNYLATVRKNNNSLPDKVRIRSVDLSEAD